MRAALATIGVGRQAALLRRSRPLFTDYARQHAYELVIGDGVMPEPRPPQWSKVALLRRLVDDYDLVLWLDADLMILDGSDNIADLLRPDSYQALVMGALGPNTGVWLLRGSDRARRFLDAAWNADLSNDGINWWDNSAVLNLLGYDISCWPPSFKRATEWSEGTQALPEEWNRVTTWDHWQGARFHHVAGERHFLRVVQMEADRQLLAGHRLRSLLFRAPWWIVWRLRRSPLYARVRHPAMRSSC
jgi:hypothetical protein